MIKHIFCYLKPVLFKKIRFEKQLKENKEVYEDIQKLFASNRVGNKLKGQSVFVFFVQFNISAINESCFEKNPTI